MKCYNLHAQNMVNSVNDADDIWLTVQLLIRILGLISIDNFRYEFFDFHHECGLSRWDRLSILVDKLEKVRKQFG